MKEALLSRATRSTILEEAPEIYNATGNCIAYALRCLLGEHKAVLEHLSIDDAEDNRRAASRGHRSYAAVAALFKTHLLPKYGGSLSEAGDFLLHCEPAGSPHCMAVRVLPGAEHCEIFCRRRRLWYRCRCTITRFAVVQIPDCWWFFKLYHRPKVIAPVHIWESCCIFLPVLLTTIPLNH